MIKNVFKGDISLGTKIILIVAIPIFSVISLSSFMSYRRSVSELEEFIADQSQDLVNLLKRDLEQIIFLGDQNVGMGLSDRLKSFDQVLSFEAYNQDDSLIFRYRSQNLIKSFQDQNKVISSGLLYSISLADKSGEYGKVELLIDGGVITASRDKLLADSILVFSIFILVGIVTSLILRKILVTPAKTIARFLKEIADKGNYDCRLDHRYKAELRLIQDGINSLLVDILQREEKLRVSIYEAQSSEKEMARLLANMSHEIRTPLNGILGMAQILDESELPEDLKDYTKALLNSSESLLTLLNDILDLSKADACKVTLEKIPFDVREVVEEIGFLYSTVLGGKQIELLTYVPVELPSSRLGDPFRLRQILRNIVGNAIKFTEKGFVSIRVNKSCKSEDYLEFIVEDTGIGISQEDIERIFKPFSQASDSISRTYGGTGLGLTISFRLCQLMKGTIDVESEVGSGTQFKVTIPLEVSSHNNGSAPKFSRSVKVRTSIANNQLNEIVENYLSGMGLNEVSQLPKEGSGISLSQIIMYDDRPEIIILDEASVIGWVDIMNEIDAIPDNEINQVIVLSSNSNSTLQSNDVFNVDYFQLPIKYSRFRKFIADFVDGVESVEGGDSKSALLNPTDESTNIKVLLAEDNLVNRKVALKALNKFGFEVTAVENGEAAVAEVLSGSYDIILMDYRMPVMDGVAATKKIRALEDAEKSSIPIIALTANAFEDDRERCFEAGMDDFLTKPFKFHELKDFIMKWVNQNLEKSNLV